MAKEVKIAFISFSSISLGVRLISSYLKSQGSKDIKILFFPNSFFDPELNNKTLENIYSLVSDCDLIGLSVVNMTYKPIIQINDYLQERLDIPVVWGGTEAVSNPSGAIKKTNFVCYGEGEETFLKLAKAIQNNKDIYSIPNLYTKKKGKVKINPPEPLVENLDKYPFPDFDLNLHYIYDKKTNRFREFTRNDLINDTFENTLKQYGNYNKYYIMTMRGCPHSCTYCWNNIANKRFGYKFLRKRSIKNVIEELKWVKKKFPEVNYIDFRDDTFLSRPMKELEEFSSLYKKHINIPFYMTTTPGSVTEQRLKVLADCGMTYVKVGVESGSERILKEIYRRPFTNKQALDAANLIHKQKFKFISTYDFIFNNPFETIDDNIKTLKLIAQLPNPSYCLYNNLIYLPGTELHSMAKKAGFFIEDREYGESLRRGHFDYMRFYTAFFPIIPFNLPKFVMNFFTNKKVVTFLQNKRFNSFFRIMTVATYSLQYLMHIFYYRIIKSGFSLGEIKSSINIIKWYISSGTFKFRAAG